MSSRRPQRSDRGRPRVSMPGFDPLSEGLIDGIVAEWGRVVRGQDPVAREIVAVIMRVAALLQQDTDRVLARHGLRETEFRLLAGLRRAGPPFCRSPSELTPRYVPVTSGGLSGVISRMAGRGLVRRRRRPGDGRGVLVELTPAGRTLIQEVMTAVARRETLLLRSLGQRQMRQAAVLLRRLLRAANSRASEAPVL